MAYVTEAEIRAAASALASTTTYPQADVLAAADHATIAVDEFCGQFFDSLSTTLTVDGDGTPTLRLLARRSDGRLLRARIQSVSSVSYVDGGVSAFSSADYVADAGDYEIRKKTLGITASWWIAGPSNHEVAGVFGFAAVPDTVKRATIVLAVRKLVRDRVMLANAMEHDFDSESVGDHSGKAAAHVFDLKRSTGVREVDRMLMPWRRRGGMSS